MTSVYVRAHNNGNGKRAVARSPSSNMPAPAQQPRLSKHLPRSQRNKQRGACKTTDRVTL